MAAARGGRLTRRLKKIAADERGVALISVMGVAAILAGITSVLAAQSINNQRSVSAQRIREQALQIADSGVDHTMYAIGQDPSYNTGDMLPPSFSSNKAEKDWALAAAASKAVTAAPGGEWAAVKPLNSAVIYAVGYVPSRANPKKVRVVRADYDSGPFMPPVAVLSDRDVEISGNAKLEGTSGSAHANGNAYASGSASLSGFFSASGTLSGDIEVGDESNTGGGRPIRGVPEYNPRDFYFMSEYDLCPDGTVRTGPGYMGSEGSNPSDVPCTGPSLGDGTSGSYRGWKFEAGNKWHYKNKENYDGVYYVYQADAKVSGNPGHAGQQWAASILVEPVGEGKCTASGGNLEITGTPRMASYASAQQILAVTGNNLRVSGNTDIGMVRLDGVLATRQQFEITGNADISGVLIASDVCEAGGPSMVSGSATITYNSDYEVPANGSIRNTLWAEL